MPGIKSMNANAGADGGGVFVQFSDWSRDVAIAASEARERIDAIRDQLPDDFRRYFVFRWSTSDREAMSLRLTSKEDLTARGESRWIAGRQIGTRVASEPRQCESPDSSWCARRAWGARSARSIPRTPSSTS